MINTEKETRQAETMNDFMREGFSKASPQAERLAKAITGGYDNPLDALDRSVFKSDDEFFDAAARMTLERETPEYREARKRIEAEYTQRKEAEERERQREDYETYKKSVTLNDFERADIDNEAQRLAEGDLRLGKISSAELVHTINKHKDILTEKKKAEKASSMLFNAMLRGK